MRIFIGIGFPTDVKEYLSDVQSIVKLNSLKGNFTHYNNFHLTLRFLGELNQQEVDLCSDVLDELSREVAAFSLKIGDLNSFQRKNKHIVYVDVIKNKDKLNSFVYKLDKLLDESGFEKRTGKFKAHITIAREVELPQISVLQTLTRYKEDIDIQQVTLYLSHREQNQLIYTPIYTVNLLDK